MMPMTPVKIKRMPMIREHNISSDFHPGSAGDLMLNTWWLPMSNLQILRE